MNMGLTHKLTGCLIVCMALALPSARAEVVPVVSVKCEIASLSDRQLVDIFLGRESRFPNGEPAMPLDQAEGSEVRDEFYARYANQSPAQLKVYWSKLIFTGKSQPPREIVSMQKLRRVLANNPYAISYMRRNEVDATLRVLEIQGKR